ncbi:hypothetical protein CYY_000829 [Polysphondylium violaceum]|uniref:SMCHD1 ribosomal S5 domain-containing protein n=1 Tax=Polysphondylium violaceum TaxID=133409 RepID=A0A8J4V8I8_9MYCE|nr:hypothetical protein CYY_000829 [Polysphondylium violaceum]
MERKRKSVGGNGGGSSEASTPNKKALTLPPSIPSSPSSQLVVRNIPDSITISRRGIRHTIDTPSNYKELLIKINHLYQLPKDYIISDLSSNRVDNEASYQSYLNTSNNLLVVYSQGETPLETSEEIVVDITPSKNILLKAGTSEYNFTNAIAEFIDNSIQAVRDNEVNNRIVKVNIAKPNSSTNLTTITVWDNGCGMNKDVLQRWATMGLSQADLLTMPEDQAISASGKTEGSHNFTGLISRYGVGGKKAAFYLGEEIVVSTKVKGSRWINEARISLDILASTGDQDWKIPIVIREPTKEELEWGQHFTFVTIKNVALDSTTYPEQMLFLKRDLAHVYYYYLHDIGKFDVSNLKINTMKTRRATHDIDTANSDSESDDSDSDLDSDDGNQQVGYLLQINETSLHTIKDDMESLYIKYGKRFKTFELNVPLDNNKTSKVLCHLRYFPFKDALETLPVPYRLLHEKEKLDYEYSPLSLRKPGIEIFWNGRLISEGHIDRLGFMSSGTKIDGEKIEDKWVQRVKGAIFLNSDFPVTHNKMHIIKESPIFQSLIKSQNRSQTLDWKKWVLACHKLDQDFQIEGTTDYHPSINRTICKAVSFGGTTYTAGDGVSINNRPVTYGIIRSIYFTGTQESRSSDIQFEIEKVNYKPLPTESIPGAKIKAKMDKKDMSSLITLAKNKEPSKLKLFEGDKVDLPKSEYLSGEKIKWITVALYDKSTPPKEVEKRILEAENIKMGFTIKYKPPQGGQAIEVYKNESSVFYQSSRVSFKDIGCLKKQGTYTFIFSCNYQGVADINHTVIVKPGKVDRIKAEFGCDLTELSQFPIGVDLPPIIVEQIDQEGNMLPTNSIPKTISFTAVKRSEITNTPQDVDDRSNILQLSVPKQLSIKDGRLVVNDLKIVSASLNEEDKMGVLITCTIQTFTCELPLIQIISGQPVSMFISEKMFISDPEKPSFKNHSFLPDFSIQLLDKDGNFCKVSNKKLASTRSRRKPAAPANTPTPNYYIAVSSPFLKDTFLFTPDENGLFSLNPSNVLQTNKKKGGRSSHQNTGLLIEDNQTYMDTDADSSLPTLRKTRSSSKEKDQDIHSIMPILFQVGQGDSQLFEMEQKIKVVPSDRPAFLDVTKMDEFVVDTGDDTFKVLAGTDIQFYLKVRSCGGGGKGPFVLGSVNGQLNTNWSSKVTSVEMSPTDNTVQLPILSADKSAKLIKYSIEYTVEYEGEQICLKKQFSIRTIGGAPTSFFLQRGKGSTEKIRCDSEVSFEVSLFDRKGNTVSPANLTSGKPIQPFFELEIQDGDSPSNGREFSIKNQVIGEFNFDKNVYPCKLSILGLGKMTLKVVDNSGQINSHSIKVILREGSAALLTVNDLPQLTIPCAGGEQFDDLRINICDSQGNRSMDITGVDIHFEWEDLNGRQPPFDIKSKLIIDKGEGYFKGIAVKNTAQEGTYKLILQPGITIERAVILFQVAGNYSMEFVNPDSLLCSLNAPPKPFKIQIISPQKKPVQLNIASIKALSLHQTFPCTAYKDDCYIFDYKVPRKAGPHKITFVLNENGLRLENQQTLVVLPDLPSRLHISGQISSSTSSSIGSNIAVYVTDNFDNRVNVRGSMRVLIEKSIVENSANSSQNIDVPMFLDGKNYQDTQFNDSGEAFFGNLRLLDSIGISGPYKVCFTPNITSVADQPEVKQFNNIQSLSKEFFYKNAKEDIDRNVELQEKRVSLRTEIGKIEKQIADLNKEQDNITSKYKNDMAQAEDISRKLCQMIPGFANVSQNPELVKNLIAESSKDLDTLVNRNRRTAPLFNPVSRELNDVSRSQGEQSGIVGLVNTLIFVEDEREATSYSKLVGKKAEAVIFSNKDDFQSYNKKYREQAQSSFYAVSLDNMIPFSRQPRRQNGYNNQQSQDVTEQGLLNLSPQEGAPLVGFLGYSCNRVQLREKHQHLRKTLVWSLFRDTMVFDTMEHGLAYRTFLARQNRPCSPIYCITEAEYIETSGFVEVGGAKRGGTCCFGQLPVSETEEYKQLYKKKSLLSDYKKVRHQLYVDRKNEVHPQLSGIKDQINELTRLKEQKLNTLNDIFDEIKILETPFSQRS